MELTQEDIRNALRQVVDPELGQNLVDLDMVREVRVVDGQVEVTLALTTLACPLKDRLVGEARAAIAGLPEVTGVEVHLTEMTAEERSRLFRGAVEPTTAQQMNDIDHVVAVMSGKGGVGKSLVTALLAVGLARQGQRVGILDADITGPTIPRLFGLRDRPIGMPWGILPVQSTLGIRIISVNLLLPSEDEAVIWRGPLIDGLIRPFWTEVVWGQLDYLLVDLPPGTADAPLTVMQVLPLDGVVLVTTPQELAAMVVRKALRMAQAMDVPLLGLVENMSYFVCPETGSHHEIFGPSGAEALARAADVPLLARLPVDPQISRLCDAGEIEAYDSEAATALAGALAGQVLARKSVPSGDIG